MGYALIVLLIFFTPKSMGVKDCFFTIDDKLDENPDYRIATFSLPSRLKNFVTVEFATKKFTDEDKENPGTIRLYYDKEKTLNRILDVERIKYLIKYPSFIETITSVTFNDKLYCEHDWESSFAPHTLIMDFNVTVSRTNKLLISKETYYLAKNARDPEVLLKYRSMDPPSSRYTDISKQNEWLRNFYNDECGKKDLVVVQTVINGREVSPYEFPWMVAIFNEKLQYFCGGTLVSEEHIISAAHCTLNRTKVYMGLGRHNIDQGETGGMMVSSKNIINHPDYLTSTGHADISIIVATKKIPFTKKIRPICIWSFFSHDIGEIGTVAGWGTDISGDSTSTPMAAEVKIVADKDCKESHELFSNFTSETTFCAGGNNKGPCHGDSGSGFVVEKDGRWYLKGIISVSLSARINFCDVNKYAVYCDVGKYLGWLKRYLL